MSREADELKRALGPLRLLLGPLVSIADQINQQVQAETSSPEAIRARLRQLGQQLEAGDISEAAYEEAEEALLDALEQTES